MPEAALNPRAWPLSRGLEGALLAFEGIDGSGKSTQASRLATTLRVEGLEVVLTKEPTDGPHGARLRKSFVTARLPPSDELELFIADRREHVDTVIRPALERGAVVIVDRYYYSTVAYQGARGFDADDVLRRNREFAPRPALVFLVDLEPAVALERIGRRQGGRDLLENLDEQLKVRAAFLKLAGTQPHFRVIDGRQSADQMQAQIEAQLREFRADRPPIA